MKNKSVKLPFVTITLYLHATKQLLPVLTIVTVGTLSNQNIVVCSKTFSEN